MLRRAAEEMHGQRQPATVERYLGHTIPLCNVQEFKSLLRPAFCIHYAQVSRLCSYTCDKFSAACDLVARLRLGYRYYWEVGGAPPVPCALCARPGGHMLQHYVLHSSVISDYRSQSHWDLPELVGWFLNQKYPASNIKTISYLCH